MITNRGQITIFIIIAIALLAGIGIYFYAKSGTSISGIPSDFKPVEETFLSCVQDYVKNGIGMLEERGGYIYAPAFEPGSEYMPSSNMLDLSGLGIPYWYYISGNNIAKEQVPSKLEMQKQLERYLNENLKCDFSSYSLKGYIIDVDEIKSSVSILNDRVDVQIVSGLNIQFGEKSYKINEHQSNVNSKLGKFYDEALKIYNAEKTSVFLEKYGLDVLYSYAPVTGVEISCAQKVWSVSDVTAELKQGLEANTIMLKTKGNYYEKTDSYFIANVQSDDAVQFMYSGSWPTKIEVLGNDNFLVAQPVGNQQGLGIMGFCYVPLHFVYNMVYPVLIQIYDSQEIFRFPVIVVIQGNKEKSPEPGTYFGEVTSQLCSNQNQRVSVYTYDNALEPVEADISFECFGESCNIGRTKISGGEAVLKGAMPQCVNGYITARETGYKDKRYLISTNVDNSANIILDKLYNVDFSMDIGDNSAVVYFEGGDYSTSLVWPNQKSVFLADGMYNVTAYSYRNGSVSIPGTNQKKCINSPKPGLLGFFGATTENCFDLNLPEQIVSNIVSGGGKSQIYLAESDLAKGKASIKIPQVALPSNVEELQKVYSQIENNGVEIEF